MPGGPAQQFKATLQIGPPFVLIFEFGHDAERLAEVFLVKPFPLAVVADSPLVTAHQLPIRSLSNSTGYLSCAPATVSRLWAISCETRRRPLLGLGFTLSRTSGTSTSVLVNGVCVTRHESVQPVQSGRSSHQGPALLCAAIRADWPLAASLSLKHRTDFRRQHSPVFSGSARVKEPFAICPFEAGPPG
jgi:hypothetical protein